MSSIERASIPLISMKIEPKSKADKSALLGALADLTQADPSLSFTVDAESGETFLGGESELQLDGAVDNLISSGLGISVGAPQVAYREVLARRVDVDYTHNKQVGSVRQFARVKLRLEPNETGKGNEFAAEIVGSTVPEKYFPSVEKGVRSVWENGVLIGFPLVDMTVTLLDGAFHEGHSAAAAFEIAARQAIREGCKRAGVKILEPIINLQVLTPSGCVVGIIDDLNSRRANISRQELRGDETFIDAQVPLGNMFGIMSSLRKLSHSRASHRMSFSHYQEIPRNVTPDPGTFPPAVGMRA
jgi:elongation factor G